MQPPSRLDASDQSSKIQRSRQRTRDRAEREAVFARQALLTSGAAVGPVRSGGLALRAPQLIQTLAGLLLVRFSTMKLLPAYGIVLAALLSGRLRPGGTVVATSSGTFALGVAHVCRDLGLGCIVVSDPAIDAPFERKLTMLGAVVDIVAVPAVVGGFQQARLDRVDEWAARMPDAFIADQYGDPANADSYLAVADAIVRAHGPVDMLVGTVGSGGSMSGLAAGLRRHNPLAATAVDTPGSVLFGLEDAKRELRGLGNSLMPANVLHETFDYVAWIDAPTAYNATLELYRETGAFSGPTSGAAYAVAKWAAREWPGARIAVVLPDDGSRYLESVYNSDWLSPKLDGFVADAEPRLVSHPREVAPTGMSIMAWDGRSLADVVTVRPVVG